MAQPRYRNEINAKVRTYWAVNPDEAKSVGVIVKIDNSYQPVLPPTSGKTAVRPSATSRESADVQLSGLSAELATSENQPPLDASKIQEIKQAIAEGRFTINTSAIADRLIASAREMVNSRRQA